MQTVVLESRVECIQRYRFLEVYMDCWSLLWSCSNPGNYTQPPPPPSILHHKFLNFFKRWSAVSWGLIACICWNVKTKLKNRNKTKTIEEIWNFEERRFNSDFEKYIIKLNLIVHWWQQNHCLSCALNPTFGDIVSALWP